MPLISTAVLPEESGCISSPKVETTIQQTSAICFQSELRKKLLTDWCLFFTNKKYQNCHLDLAKEAYPCFIDSNRNSKSLVNLILTHALSRMYWEFFSSVTGPILLCTLVPLHLLSYFTSSQSKGHPTHKIQQERKQPQQKVLKQVQIKLLCNKTSNAPSYHWETEDTEEMERGRNQLMLYSVWVIYTSWNRIIFRQCIGFMKEYNMLSFPSSTTTS